MVTVGDQPKNVAVGNNESHESACAFGEQREVMEKMTSVTVTGVKYVLFDTSNSWNMFLNVVPQETEGLVITACNH